MTDDIVARLRNGYALDYDQNELFKFCNEAADEIEWLRAEIDRMQATFINLNLKIEALEGEIRETAEASHD
jgi:uncharacterized coiled-coil DUF342 family protein